MESYLEEISKSSLFEGIQRKDLKPMLQCIGGYIKTYQKGEFITLTNEEIKRVGIVLGGTVHMIKEDVWGHKTILTFIQEGELFGETFACGNAFVSTVTFLSAEDSTVLFLPFYKVIKSCTKACEFHHRLIQNMVTLIAVKNTQLMEKVEITSKKTLREKILSYLSFQAQKNHCDAFEIPLKRTELADYLCADRSALTRELQNMKADGLILFDKNTFRLLK